MLKSLREIMTHNFYETDNKEYLRKINLPIYYNFEEMLDMFLEMHSGASGAVSPSMITVICVTYTAYRTAIQKGFI